MRLDSVLVFVCGAAPKDGDDAGDGAREQFMYHARRHLSDFRFFLAESVIEGLKGKGESDLLSIERDLAAFSDCIVIIMESAGALVELGAFTINDDLAQIVLAINDIRFRDASSETFINAGPLKKLERHSRFGEVIYADFRRFFSVVPEVKSRLKREFSFKHRRLVRLGSHEEWAGCQAKNRKLRMFLLHDLIQLLAPIPHAGLVNVLRQLYGQHNYDAITLELAVLRALKLVEVIDDHYFPATAPGELFFTYPDDLARRVRSATLNRYHRIGGAEDAALQKHFAQRCPA